jgi:hypothetical protein
MSRTRLPIAVFAVAVFAITAGCSYTPYSPPELAFSGDSSEAEKTVIVPTINSPARKGRNVIWCATFQLCWDNLKTVFGSIQVPPAAEMVRLLDASPFSQSDLPEGSYYAAAGLIGDGIVEQIKAGMAERFPDVTPNLPVDDEFEAVAYAYLADGITFSKAYFPREGGDIFVDSAGNRTRVSSFGLFKQRDASVNSTLARQIEVLYCEGDQLQPVEFALDLDRNSHPTQLILACVAPGATLAETWQKVQRKMAQWQAANGCREFVSGDSLVVPDINYRITHHFKELESTGLLRTMQSVEFRLDRSGAGLASEAFIMGNRGGRSFNFARPFLVVMRKRGSAQPFFLMWVDNAELLCKQDAGRDDVK